LVYAFRQTKRRQDVASGGSGCRNLTGNTLEQLFHYEIRFLREGPEPQYEVFDKDKVGNSLLIKK